MDRGEVPVEHEGEKYLRLLGLEGLADEEIVTSRGTIKWRDFLDICGEHARPALAGLEAMDPQDPRYQQAIEGLRSGIRQFVEKS